MCIKYIDLLNKSWAEHLKEREKDAPTVISLFAGCGGSSLGYSMAGYREILAIEKDPHAAEIFRLNFPKVPIIEDDIKNISIESIKNIIEDKDLDLLDGSPPCQGFSTFGRRNLDDSRNNLFLEYIRILEGLKPKMFVLENVQGLALGKMKEKLKEIATNLKASGYKIKLAILNASSCNVPQNRPRLIILGLRNDLKKELCFPKPTKNRFVVGDCAEGIETIGIHLEGTMAKIGETARPYEDLKAVRERLGIKKKGMWSAKKVAWDRPSFCMAKTMAPRICGLIHPDCNNMISIALAKRISGFPDQFKLQGTEKEQWARLGNCVPPLMIEVLAKHIKDNFWDHAT